MQELSEARVEGKSYLDVANDVVRIVNYFVNLWYDKYPILKVYNCMPDHIVTEVYSGLSNRNRDDGLSNLEYYFLNASKLEKNGMKYIMNTIKKSVLSVFLCRSRDLPRKPAALSLNTPLGNADSGKELSLAEMIPDPQVDIEKQVELKLMLESIPNKKYSGYYYIDSFGSKRNVTTKKIINWLLSGYTISEMKEKVFNKHKENISYICMSKMRNESIQAAKSVLFDED